MKKVLSLLYIAFGLLQVNAQLPCTSATAMCPNHLLPPSIPSISLGAVECLGSTENPQWYYAKAATSGSISLQIIASTINNSGLDVDYALWGPFDTWQEGCDSISNGLPAMRCSYSTAAWETVTFSTEACKYYIFLISVYSNGGAVNIIQTGGNAGLDCSITGNPSAYSISISNPFCAGSSNIFTPNTIYEGHNLSYEWKINGVVESTDSVFHSNSLQLGDTITFEYTSELYCPDRIYTAVSDPYIVTSAPSFSQITAFICEGDVYNFNGNILTQTGMYMDTLTNLSGCDSIVTLLLTSNPTSSLSYSVSICDGESYHFNGNTLTQDGIYKDTLTDIHWCDSIITLSLIINPLPQPAIIQNSDSLFTEPYNSYQWFLNDSAITGATSQIYIPVQEGSYSVVVSNSGNCSNASAPYSFSLSDIRDITQKSLVIYPNPSNGAFNLYAKLESNQVVQLRVYTTLGELVFDKKISPVNHQLNEVISLKDLAKGIYSVHFLINNQAYYRNLIVR